MFTAKDLAHQIYLPDNIERIKCDFSKYNVYNGKLRDEIRAAIQKEFLLPETVRNMAGRIIPVNVMQKVVNKLAQVFKNAPQRGTANDDQDDEENYQTFAKVMKLNQTGKLANRYFKLNKGVVYEPYVSTKGVPSSRALPSYSYTQFSDDSVDPQIPTHTVKHLDMTGADRKMHKHIVWSDEEHFVMDGNGVILDNPGNPYGVNPLVYVKEGDCLMPIPDDDLYYLQIAICLLLTDLAFATKYQAWSIIYMIGVANMKLSFNPNSVLTLPFGKDGEKPEVGTIKPTLDTASLLSQVEALIGLLLTTKSLSVGSMTMSLDGSSGSPQSGVAKILDASETTEDQEDQRQYFIDGEQEVAKKTIQSMLPVWIKKQMIDPRYILRFSNEFDPSITFEDAKPVLSEKEQVETEALKVSKGFATQRMALENLYPEKTPEELDKLEKEIAEEEIKKMALLPPLPPAIPPKAPPTNGALNGGIAPAGNKPKQADK